MNNNIYQQQTTAYLEGLRDRLIEESATNTQAQWIAMMISDILNERKALATKWPNVPNAECIWAIDILVKENWIISDVIKDIPCGWLCWWECGLDCKNL